MIVYSVDLSLKARVGILAYWWQGAREVSRYTFRASVCAQATCRWKGRLS